MKRQLWWFLIITLLVAGLFPLATGPARAQSDQTLARIDQAMTHLGNYLGENVSRATNNWRWEERIYNDQSLGCPVPGADYTPQSTGGYQITITVDDVDYDYRSTYSGDILILCLNGQPHPTSIGVDFGEAPQTAGQVDMPVSAWWALAYLRSTDRLVWVNPSGEHTALQRPGLPGEAAEVYPQLHVTRNGRYLVQSVLNGQDQAVIGIYDFQNGVITGTFTTQAGEVVGGIMRYGSDPFSQRVAVGLSLPEWENNNVPFWRVIILDLATGNLVDELRSDGPELANFVGGENFTNSSLIPQTVYYTTDQGVPVIHLRFANFGEPPFDQPALAWYPDGVPGIGREIVASPYSRAGTDINPVDGNAVFPALDPDTALAQVPLPYAQFNAVATGTPVSASNWPGPTIQYASDQAVFYTARWASGGQQILFNAADDPQGDNFWLSTQVDVPLGTATNLNLTIFNPLGTSDGFVVIDNNQILYWGDLNANLTQVYQAPAGSQAELVWVTPLDGTPLGMNSMVAGLTTPSGQAQLCAGAPDSRVGVGDRARVTFSDGQPLRLRQEPGGAIITEMPEGTEFQVIGGPRCAQGFAWWQLQLDDGRTGWSAEGDAEQYYLEPLLMGGPSG
jgi:hypothetical protein